MAQWPHRWKRVIEKLEVVVDDAAAQHLLERLATPESATVLGFVNAHAMNLVVRDGAYCGALTAADVLLRDGSGMAILYRRLGLEPGLNMNGTDFIPRLMAAYRGRKVAFWGTRQPYLGQAVQRCEAEFGIVPVSVHDGFANAETYLQLAREQQPELIVLGMGMPKQEAVAAELAAIGVPCLIVCGGAILDFLGGKVSRAPEWLRRLGGEWLYRLLREPKRLFLRYVVGNPLFLLRTLLYRRAAVSARRTV
ncbi:TPA: WecB/TagA/CpsF family glycosyltransferase [Pseudomonas putida]|uniref:Glycosyl transferase, WecB/TagA/CpsF family n=1 Tax=Pseudomonas putida (strain GB-1) TaxID=76869 RepID=B0KTC4_PSEPG|nr:MULTISPECIES: WecB/TagA/CpsF family glycosyltransferase [Pseudomonas]ABY98611.1 glycosyl transferase, WecB/TagA/CpsF family [Pseudomonas putida GB-1]APE98937.1 glycosyl transferase [Pseudomonas putida]MBP0709654.1 WecB/TagA/CpsF family glycosyltransferase [Pseudomonas sp. T34]MCE1001601.1 WecB/TagA/CpsF family glycosyltransferase [Pseudomonas sp. NMI1173_11]MCK2189097.1 WecB/TagA/CpsF family glycosyltransferase [Pseudomonas sp. MB04B]